MNQQTFDRIAATRRPDRGRQGSQRWHRLLFVHWEVPQEVLRPLVDPRLTLDDFEGRFFVGLVPFTMQRVRPYDWLPSMPTATTFGEINLRTYVHLDGQEPGVWFFSLDAHSSIAVQAARTLWHLPYFRSDMTCEDDGATVRWTSRRRWPRPQASDFSVSYRVGEPIPPPQPGSLEFFLAERYQFYTTRREMLLRARVYHVPYPLQLANEVQVSPSLLDAAGLPSSGPRTVDLFSPGVDVDIFSMETVSSEGASAAVNARAAS
jgi:uncharacterized protein YqjF (DUF2071 family)